MMINAEPPRKADVILVLAGDWRGGRIVHAGKLVREGFAPKALVSGPGAYYDVHEDEAAIAYAARRGYAASYFEPLRISATSTESEALAILPKLRAMGYKKVLVVTSDYHTRRASRIYRRLAPDLDLSVTAAPDAIFSAGGWWKSREGQKTWLLEFTKLVTSPFGI